MGRVSAFGCLLAILAAVLFFGDGRALAQSQGFCKEDCERNCRNQGLGERCLAVCATRKACDTSIPARQRELHVGEKQLPPFLRSERRRRVPA